MRATRMFLSPCRPLLGEGAIMAAHAAVIASSALCASCSMSVLLDLYTRCPERRVMLAVPIEIAKRRLIVAPLAPSSSDLNNATSVCNHLAVGGSNQRLTMRCREYVRHYDNGQTGISSP
jgi:hypothetical protein